MLTKTKEKKIATIFQMMTKKKSLFAKEIWILSNKPLIAFKFNYIQCFKKKLWKMHFECAKADPLIKGGNGFPINVPLTDRNSLFLRIGELFFLSSISKLSIEQDWTPNQPLPEINWYYVSLERQIFTYNLA